MEFKNHINDKFFVTYEAKSAWHNFWHVRKPKSYTTIDARGFSQTRHVDVMGRGMLVEERNEKGELHGETTNYSNDYEITTYHNGKKHGEYFGPVFLTADKAPTDAEHAAIKARRSGQYEHNRKVGLWQDASVVDGTLYSQSYYSEDPKGLNFKIVYDEQQEPCKVVALYHGYEIYWESGIGIKTFATADLEEETEKLPLPEPSYAMFIYNATKGEVRDAMLKKWSNTRNDCDRSVEEMSAREDKECCELEEKIKETRASYVEEKQILKDKREGEKNKITTIFKLSGQSHINLRL